MSCRRPSCHGRFRPRLAVGGKLQHRWGLIAACLALGAQLLAAPTPALADTITLIPGSPNPCGGCWSFAQRNLGRAPQTRRRRGAEHQFPGLQQLRPRQRAAALNHAQSQQLRVRHRHLHHPRRAAKRRIHHRPAVQTNVTILGNGKRLSGDNHYRGFFVRLAFGRPVSRPNDRQRKGLPPDLRWNGEQPEGRRTSFGIRMTVAEGHRRRRKAKSARPAW